MALLRPALGFTGTTSLYCASAVPPAPTSSRSSYFAGYETRTETVTYDLVAPEDIAARVGHAAEDEQQVRQPVEVFRR